MNGEGPPRGGAHTSAIASRSQSSAVVRHDARTRFARREFEQTLIEAHAALTDARAGDIVAVYYAHRLIGRAVHLLLENRWDAA